jgi:signal transduction histidine kinase
MKTNNMAYEPTVTVSTKRIRSHSSIKNEEVEQVVVMVKDNGNGIPKKVIEKIFQPFFTTKPTGEGTGLGLSLSYDIVKAHGGELKVETQVSNEISEDQEHQFKHSGSLFTIVLPVS